MGEFVKVVTLKPILEFIGESVFIRLKNKPGEPVFWFKIQGIKDSTNIEGYDSERMNRVIPLAEIEFIMPE